METRQQVDIKLVAAPTVMHSNTLKEVVNAKDDNDAVKLLDQVHTNLSSAVKAVGNAEQCLMKLTQEVSDDLSYDQVIHHVRQASQHCASAAACILTNRRSKTQSTDVLHSDAVLLKEKYESRKEINKIEHQSEIFISADETIQEESFAGDNKMVVVMKNNIDTASRNQIKIEGIVSNKNKQGYGHILPPSGITLAKSKDREVNNQQVSTEQSVPIHFINQTFQVLYENSTGEGEHVKGSDEAQTFQHTNLHILDDPPQQNIISYQEYQRVNDTDVRSSHKTKISAQETKNPVKKFKCDLCNYRCQFPRSLKIHMMTHTGERPHSCDVCSKGFTRKDHLKIHMRTHTGEMPFSCQFCDKKFISTHHKNLHIKSKHDSVIKQKLHCEVCKKLFVCKSSLNKHMEVHVENRTRSFSCDLCDKSYYYKSQLADHKISHYGVKNHACDLCQLKFASKSRLQRHMKRGHTTERNFLCKLCDQKFKSNSTLSTHTRRVHTGVKQCVCNICDKQFFQNNELIRHMRSHNKVKPIKSCNICGKIFKKKCNLDRHIRSHQRKGLVQMNVEDVQKIKVIESDVEIIVVHIDEERIEELNDHDYSSTTDPMHNASP